jgi:regulator of cell morphogenesis and NO signaling
MENIQEMSVGAIVKSNYKTAHTFTKYGIDFCCSGKTMLRDACLNKQINLDQLTKELNEILLSDASNEVIEKLTLVELVDYIVTKHHQYVETTTPILLNYAEKVANAHGARKPYLIEVYKTFKALATDLAMHMKKEELILFPYIKKLEKEAAQGLAKSSIFKTLNQPIEAMEEEHLTTGTLIEKIAQLTNNFVIPEDACATHRVMLQTLQDFRSDLFRHIHLENNILFPKSTALEQSIKNRVKQNLSSPFGMEGTSIV